MTYFKPEIIPVDGALNAIRGQGKASLSVPDATDPSQFLGTIPAYEVDE
jgi:hypothetical protein